MFKGVGKTAAHVKRVGRVTRWAEMMRVAPSILFSVDWETFVCSGAKTHVRVTKIYTAEFLYFFHYINLILFFIIIFIPQPSSCLSDREEDEIYGLTTAERRFPPATATVRPPVHLNTSIRQHTVQQP